MSYSQVGPGNVLGLWKQKNQRKLLIKLMEQKKEKIELSNQLNALWDIFAYWYDINLSNNIIEVSEL